MACTCTVRLMHLHGKIDAPVFLACVEDTLTSTVHTECSWSTQIQQLFASDYQQLTADNLFLPEYYFQEESQGQGNTCYFPIVLVFPPSCIYSVFCWSLMKLLVCVNCTQSLLPCENLGVRFTHAQEDIFAFPGTKYIFYAYLHMSVNGGHVILPEIWTKCNYISIVHICN